ncbi:hypothetical protein OAN13_06330 [Opitutales bacterium]|nr:hypothetical protein [Opitutales bacterium]
MLKKIIASISFTLVLLSISSAQAPSTIVGKKVTVIGSVTELGLSINNHFHFTSTVNQVGRYNVGLSDEDWSLERYNYRKTGEQTANLTIINYDGEQARLLLFFDSPTSGSVSGSYYNASNERLWSTLAATWTVEALDLAAIPDTELPSDPSGYYAPASLTGGTLNAQDKYWPVYDETISFTTSGLFSASITNGQDDPTGSGSYSYSTTGTNSASLSYTIDGAGITFEYALQFTGENAGIYTKFADYGGGTTDITTGPFSLSGVAIPEQFDWEDYDDFEDNTLDSSKWLYSTNYFVGNEPTMANGRVELTGLTSEHTHSNTFLILEDLDGIVGLEGDIWLPSNAPMDTGVLIGIADAGVPVGWIDLWVNENNTWLDITLENSSSGEKIDFNRDAELGVVYRVGIIKKEDKIALFLNGKKIAEVTTWDSDDLDFLFRGVNDVGSPFTAYLDNIRVIRNWEEYDDFSSGSLDSGKWEVAWFKGGRAPTVVNGALQLGGSGDPNDPASDSLPYALSLLALPENGSTHPFAIITDSSVYGLEAEIMLPSGSQYSTGLNFLCYDTTSQEADGSWKQFGPEIEYWSGQNPALEYQYLDPSTDEVVEVSLPAEFGVYYKASLIQDGSKSLIFIDGEKVADFHYPEFSPNAYGFFAFNDDGYPFETYVKNVRVLRRNQTSTEPDPVTVVSDPNGQPVVVQVGDEYKWNDTLDGVTLWGVWEEDEDGWIGATLQYENGMQKASIGLTDELGTNLEVNHPYIIDENGMIKVTEDTAFQYYQVTSVENGVIVTADDSSFPLSDTSRFFTTRAAAEEFYYSKVNPKNWMWFDHYPWVYSEEEGGWLYFYPSGGTLMYWSNKGQAWRQFNQ